MTAPKVLGVAMTMRTTGETQCTARFGMLEVGLAYIANLDGSVFGPVPWWVGKQNCSHHHNDGCESTVEAAIVAIERELLAIKSAIPDAPTTGGDDGQE